MRQIRQRRAARSQEVWALRWSQVGQHAWAIDAANQAVALRRQVAEQHPAALARALAVRAVCLQVRGRKAEAARDVDECLAYRDHASGEVDMVDLAAVASLLGQAGRVDEALTLAEQLVAGARAVPQQPSSEPAIVYGELLLQCGRAEESVVALRGAYPAAAGSSLRLRASAMLFEALAAAGHDQELKEHAHHDLWLFAVNAWGNIQGRLRYIHLLELLARHHVESHRLPPLATAIARQQRKLSRQRRRRRVLVAPLAMLVGRSRQMPEPSRTTRATETDRAAALARVEQAESDVERYRESGDARALPEAWARLAQARWQAGGQRSAALEAQRNALAEARRWATQDPEAARPTLLVNLRRFAELAGAIGLQTDAQLARAEAEDLDRADR